jgi:hypothetical protein
MKQNNVATCLLGLLRLGFPRAMSHPNLPPPPTLLTHANGVIDLEMKHG